MQPARERTMSAQNESLAVVKLGGSIVTRSGGDATPQLHDAHVAGLLADLRRASRAVILVHGSGCFGKPAAVEFGSLTGRLPAEARGIVSDVSADLERLTGLLTQRLRSAGLRPVALPAASFFAREGNRLMLRQASVARAYIGRGLTAVIGSRLGPDIGNRRLAPW